MKRFYFLAILLSAFVCGCEKDNGNGGSGSDTPVLTSTSVELKVSSEGGNYSIDYTLENPAQDGILSAGSETEWITNVNYDRLGTVTFDVDPNDAFVPREGEISVEYSYSDTLQSFSVKVIQDAPEFSYDIELLDAQVLSGYYYGTAFSSDGTIYYYIHLSDVGFDADGKALPNGTYFRLGLFSNESPADLSNITLPEGTYVLGKTGAGSVDGSRSLFFMTDGEGLTTSQNTYKELTVNVTKEGSVVSVEVIALLDDERYAHATYSGPATLKNGLDQPDDPDEPGEYYTTLTGDYEADFSGIDVMYAECYGDYYGKNSSNWMITSEDDGDGIMLDFCCEDMDSDVPQPGTYTVGYDGSAGTYMRGYVDGMYLYGSWYLELENGSVVGQAPAVEGDIVITDNGDGTYTISLDCIDDKGYNFTGTWTGKLSVVTKANAQGYSIVKERMSEKIESPKPVFASIR